MRLLDDLNIDFLSKRKTAYIISSILFLIGIFSLLLRGVELGIDFKGGSEIALEFENSVSVSDIRDKVSNIGLGSVEVKTFGTENGILLRTELQEIPANVLPDVVESVNNEINKHFAGIDAQLTDTSINALTYELPDPQTTKRVIGRLVDDGFQAIAVSTEPDNTTMEVRITIADWIETSLRESVPGNHFTVLKEEQVGPKIGQELKTDAIIAVALALLVILVYLAFRFKFAFAVGAVLALFHDVMITLGIFSLLYGVIPGLNLEISISVVAAFLTLVGYSINDTVVVFDRVRENLKIHKTAKIEDNINKAINKTMRRTLVTSLTTLLVVTVLLFFGGEVLRGFAFTLFFGILIGTYSSIFVASSFVLEYAKRTKNILQF